MSQNSCLFISFWCFECVKKEGVYMPKAGDYIYRRKNGSWEARYVKEISPDGKKKYGSVYASTCKEAKEKRQAKQEYYLLNPPPLVCASKLTIGQLAEEWLFINQMRLKPSTYQKYQGFYHNVTPYEIAVLSSTLTQEEKDMLMAERMYAPARLRPVFEIICGKYGAK